MHVNITYRAHGNYENAISQGHQAFLLEEDKCSRDVFCCNVGNLHPGSKVALTLKYVQELPLEADGALRYVLPAILNPRYQLSGGPEDSCLNMKTPVVPLEDLPYTLSLVATITSQNGIQRIQCNCPLSPIEYLGDEKTSAQLPSPPSPPPPNREAPKPFYIEIQGMDPDQPFS
ncbi:PREDICTED: von Willebrand factor A domain-containing protein 5A-like [Hipposideros armiger]|uniref:von Willebrand factor A domain-containing protein 5A-like n=1 Tax=Hipposideros armiger TaxID=186990 RepID=A0A8B7Q8E1_HIPAR|nr:PREDICTED: von Willebrand factor A domain-containing protein 5A-like [Hipposideros armiger]